MRTRFLKRVLLLSFVQAAAKCGEQQVEVPFANSHSDAVCWGWMVGSVIPGVVLSQYNKAASGGLITKTGAICSLSKLYGALQVQRSSGESLQLTRLLAHQGQGAVTGCQRFGGNPSR
ncbi:hypothetical protein KIL84_003278 [Mauremys mutica]|uniref:Uncharacterized protein n=1 Tax=Mauremys mutica TaxID=74926 RepID=A0A9D3WVF0_9SAUR|nr:hypothetical protein KIL84_003278 [Mauremys mutica]